MDSTKINDERSPIHKKVSITIICNRDYKTTKIFCYAKFDSEILVLKNAYRDDYDIRANNVMSMSTQEQERIQKDRVEIISKVEHEVITPEAKQILEDNRKRLAEKQKSESLSKKNMQIYIKLDKETNTTDKKDLQNVVINLVVQH